MLENLVAWILNNYIGEYFCLNTDQLSVAFLQGQVDLENVPLRTSSLRKFDIPLQVKHGLIGKLQLQVPLTRIRSQPWILRIRDFLVLLGPYSSNYDVEIVEQYKQQNLEKMLDELEIEQKKKLLSQLGIKFNENDEQNSWWGTTSLLSSISSNIQILLENVHIKYESSDFNFGVQIDSLHVQTTNFQWHVSFVEPTDGKNIFKKIDVKGFSIYWNPENTSTDSPIVLPLSLESLKGFFSSPSENAYILQPFTLELRMEKNSSRFPLRSTLLPRFKFNIRSQRIELELTQKQISQIQQFMDDWAMFERARPHRKWRPRSSIINSPRRWWQFAINRQLEQIRNKNICREPKTLFARLHLVNTYCRAYRHRLNCFLTSQRKGSQNVSSPSLDANKLNPPKYSHEETTLLKQIEHGADFSYSDLHILREAVFQKMLTELKQQFSNDNPEVSRTESPFQIIESEQVKLQENVSKINQQQNGGGWLNWMTNWFGAEENLRRNKELLEENADLLLNDSVYLNNLSTPKLNTPRHALSPELEEIEKRMQTEILQMLNDSLDDYNILRRDNLLAELILNFARVHLRIAADKSSKEDKNDEKQINSLMLTFDLDQLNGRIHISPKEHRTEMSITVGDLSIQQMQQQQYLRNQFEKKKDSSDSSKTTNNEESLFCGFQNNVSNSDISTSLLFTIGRRSEKNIKPKNFSPMLELFYKRLAPKMEIYHELNICCAPLAMIADDCFISALQEICCMENKTFQHSTSSTSNFSTFSNNSSKSSDETSLLLHQIFISATIPELLIELRSQKAARDCILSTLSKPAENNSFLQTHTKKRKRATNSVLLPLNFDINDIYNNNNDFEEEYIVEENEHNINQNINKNKNIKKEETNKTKISTKTSFKNKLVSTTTSNITNSQHSNLTTATTINSTSSPFVLASICGLSFTFIKKDLQQQKLNKINVGFDSINLKDLFEKTTTTTNDESLLLRIGKEKKLKSDKNGPDVTFRSLSCPDLTTSSSKHANNISINETIETSDSINLISNLPSTYLLEENLIVIEKENVGRHQTMPTIKQQIDNNIPNIKQNPKKNHSVEIVFIPNIQEGFETKYKKANCIVTGNFDEQTGVELFINRRTWLLFMDFFGFCSSSDINKNVLNNNNYIMRVELNVSNLILSMNYPKSEFTPKLGIVYIQKPKFITQIDLNVLSDPILIWMQAHSFSLTDENGLFSQRLRVGNFDKSNGKSPPCIQLKLVKNRRSMTSLPNEFDIHLTLNVDSNIVNYIHSHRYYYALLDFWLQFAELYDRLCIENEMQKQKPSQKNSQDANNLLKLRCKLDIDFTSGFRLYLPSSERSSLAVLFECDKVNISNQFCRASQIKNLLQKHLGKQQFNASNGSSLLLDDINIKIQHFSIYYGNFCVAKNIRSKNGRTSTKDDFTAYTFHKLQSAIGSDIDGNTNHNMEMQIYRNLSVRASHAVPDTFVIFRLENLTINCTSEFYKLLHVCVNNNFGEQLILQPETIPIELLELPEIDLESLEKYATFCVRLKLKGVQLNLLTPTSPFETNSFEKFATFSLQSVKVLFDSFIDSHSEIDIICKNATLEDSTNSDNTAEPFKKLLKARHEKGFNKHVASSSTNKNIESKKLLCELHIQMARDECQIFSFILIKTRVFLLFEWIEKLKLFLLLVNSNSNEFSSKSGIHCRSSTNQQQQKYSKKHSSSSQKELLNQSSSSNNNQNNRITSMFKITLKDCELIILEDSSKSDSFGLIANTSGVILYNLYDNSNELFDIQCEIQNFSISWCLMNTEKSSLTQITNESNATININISDNKTSITNERKEKTLKTTDGIEHLILKQLQNIQINLGPLIIRISLKDYFIVKYIIDKSLITWEKSQNQKFFWSDSSFANKNIHQIKQGEENQRVTIPKKWRLNADQLCIWLLKETTSSTSGSVNNIGISMAPFLRFNLFELYTHWTSRHTEMNFAVSIDNYRERPPLGWEPLLERWRIARLELDEHSQQKWNLWLRSADDSLAELNITQTFLEELIDFIAMNNELFKQTTNNKTLNSFNDLIEETRNEHSKCPKTSIIENNSFSESYKVQKQKHSNSASFIAKQRSNSGPSTSSRSNAFDPIRISHPSGIDLDIQLDLPAGIGFSLIGNSCENNDSGDELQQEELIYARFYSVRLGVQRRQNNTYVCSCSSQSIQFDNQILGADRHNLFFCDPNALRDEPVGPYPALNFEMSYTSTDILDAYESFRLKLCNSCVLLDEQLLWRLINFGKNIIDYRRNKLGQQQHQTQQVTKNCYFGAFQLEFGDISLSVLTIDKNALPPRLRLLKEKYAETLLLVNFENALVTLAPFWAHRCLTTFNNLFANIVDFYIGQLKRQKLSIFVAMDAIGNPLGFANEFKEGFEGLLFEGDVAGFTFGIGYGAANSISKVASSMAQGVGALTFDDQHEQFRRWMLRSKPEQEANALAYLYGGLKGFGVGVFGGLTAIARNTVVAARQEGVLPGVIRGVTTGAVDTFTKPLQGTLDLVEGTASAIREVVGAPLVRRAHFPKRRLRSPRVCSSMSGLLPSYSNELAEAQQDLLRITGTYALNDDNRLLSIVPFYERFTPEGWIIRHRALIVPSQSYICRNIIEGGEDYNFEEKTIVTHRILFEHLKNVQISSSNQLSLNKHKRSSSSSNLKTTNTSRPVGIDIFYNNNSNQQLNSSFNYNYQFNNNKQQPALTLLCTNTECAQYLSKQMMKAKVLYEKHLQIKRVNNCKNDGKKKIFPIFTI